MSISSKAMAKATASNYIHFIIKIVVSLALVRIMFLGMDQESYGFWALLWSIFGYSVLLDFGLGVTIQKKSAEFIGTNNLDSMDKFISTYFTVYVAIALFIAFTTIILSVNLENLFVIADTHRLEEYRSALLIFGIGSAVAFAFGFAAEILRGMHMLHIRNTVNTIFILANALALWACIVWDQSLTIFALCAVVLQFLNNLVFWIIIKRQISGLNISCKLIDFSLVRDVLQFSLSAYMVMFSNIVIFRTDQIVISAIAGVSFAGLYQVSARIAELFRQFATQFHESLGTKSAMLNATGDHKSLSLLMIHSNQIIAAIATLLFVPAFLLIEPLLFLWLHITDNDTLIAARVLLISMYILVVFRSSMVQILLMNGLHVQLMKIGLIEAAANILLSIYLVDKMGMVGAAIGTLIPNAALALFYNIPAGLHYTSMPLMQYFRTAIAPLAVALGFTLYLGMQLRSFIAPESIVTLLSDGVIMMLIFALLYFLLCFNRDMKGRIASKIFSKAVQV